MTDILEITGARREFRGSKQEGKLQLKKQRMSFSPTSSEDKIEIANISSVGHFDLPRQLNCLRVISEDGSIERFDNITNADLSQICKHVERYYSISSSAISRNLTGLNTGELEFEGNSLVFKVEGNPAFEIPLSNVSHCSQNRAEVVTEFHQNEECEVSLVEMRFHVTPTGVPGSMSEYDSSEAFHNSIMAKADVIRATSGAICTFSDLYSLTPRGRFDLRMYNRFLQLRGKTVDYKISYTTILRSYVLPNTPNRSFYYVISVDPPIKQGQTRYHYLVFQFDQDEHIDIELTFNDEIARKCSEGGLFKHLSGEAYDIVSRIISVLSGCKIVTPDSFVNSNRSKCLACSYKANSGHLYPLERGFIYVHKPTFYFRYDELDHVGFDRSGSDSNRSFDFFIMPRQSTTACVFAGMMKSDYDVLSDWVTKKNLIVRISEPKLPSSLDNDDKVEESSNEDSSDQDSDEDLNIQDLSESHSSSEEEEEDNIDVDKTVHSKKSSPAKRKSSTKSGGKRTKRRKKDPTMPKKPMSAYMLWLNENRARIKREHSSISSVTELAKVAGTIWRDLSSKTKWENMAREAKERYDVLVREWKDKQKFSQPSNFETSNYYGSSD